MTTTQAAENGLPDEPPSPVTFSIDLARMTIRELLALYDAADAASDLFFGFAAQPRCIASLDRYGCPEHNAAGAVLDGLDSAMCGLQTAIRAEAWRRDRDPKSLEWGDHIALALGLHLRDDGFLAKYAEFVAGRVREDA